MKKLLYLLFLLCGTALAQDIHLFTQRVQIDVQPPRIQCGWGECGLQVKRNTTSLDGGAFVNTESVVGVWNVVGKLVKSREFTQLIITESFQDTGEAVSLYLKTEKRGTAPAWAGTFELSDWENKAGAAVGIEVDMFTSNVATDPEGDPAANGGRMRVGVDIVGGDEKFKRFGAQSGAQGSLGLNIYATPTTNWFRWVSGAQVKSYLRNGLILHGEKLGAWTPERAIKIKGDHVVGIDFSGGNFQSALRLKEGQAYSFDEFDDWMMKRNGNEVQFLQRALVNGTWQHVVVFSVNRGGEVKAKKFTVIP